MSVSPSPKQDAEDTNTKTHTLASEHSRLHTYGCWATELKIHTLVVVPPS